MQNSLSNKYGDLGIGDYSSSALKHPLFANLNRISDDANIDPEIESSLKNKKAENSMSTVPELVEKPDYALFWNGVDSSQLPKAMYASMLKLSKKWEGISDYSDKGGFLSNDNLRSSSESGKKDLPGISRSPGSSSASKAFDLKNKTNTARTARMIEKIKEKRGVSYTA